MADQEKLRELEELHTPKQTRDLIAAEERYLVAMGWAVTHREGIRYSRWSSHKYAIEFTRNHAVLIAKSEDRNMGVA